ncbi:MAG: flavin reductase family protein [Pseudorhodoplanes sp.]|jgi:flavin reductase (DIM6/NTAB) family NADH-FMN oxidoreductase RutF|nr:flavin reductase family protein [Pseudorhodoplanes sp.]
MFYETRKNDHGLPHDPFKAIVAPRPIGWISSVNAKGDINLAPYSFFNGVASRPPVVMFASEGRKDSLAFIAETGEFVCNLATWDLRHAMNATSAPLPRGSNEMVHAGLASAPSRLVQPPRVAASPCALECKLLQIVQLSDVDGRALDNHVVFGQVIGVHIDDRYIADGLLDSAAMKPIARCGYHDYSVMESTFSMRRPQG